MPFWQKGGIMTMMINSDINMAIVQFGRKPNDEELEKIAIALAREGLAHWYFFEETADKEFEIKELKTHYNFVYECVDTENFYEV